MPTEGPRVRDLTEKQRSLAVEVASGPAFEVLASLCVFSEHADEAAEYEVGAEWFDGVRKSASPGLLEELAGLESCDIWLGLLGEALETPTPHTVAGLVERLTRADPVDLRRRLLTMASHGSEVANPQLVERAAAGDATALAELQAGCEECGSIPLRNLFGTEPAETTRTLARVVQRFDKEVFKGGVGVTGVLSRDADEKRAMAATMEPERLVEVATAGVTFKLQPEMSGIVLIPSVVLRPWAAVADHGSLRLFVYPVPEEALGADPGAQPKWMLSLYKALADERRLRILNVLSTGPASLGDITDQVGLAKSTVHHHLRALRTAGLVRITVGEDKSYSLRTDAVADAGRMLETYLSGPATAGIRATEEGRGNR
jgi:DNA-binding transcriptional ArsR family regulator